MYIFQINKLVIIIKYRQEIFRFFFFKLRNQQNIKSNNLLLKRLA